MRVCHSTSSTMPLLRFKEGTCANRLVHAAPEIGGGHGDAEKLEAHGHDTLKYLRWAPGNHRPS
jgi:hypothetical protein